MIFSTDLCPLCNKKLEMEILEGNTSSTLNIQYYCPQMDRMRNAANTLTTDHPHYQNNCYTGGDMAIMIFEGLFVAHFESHKLTRVYKNAPDQPPQLIYQIPLLDVDYSKTHAVAVRLKRLVPFS